MKTVQLAADIRSAHRELHLLADSMPSLTDLDDGFLVFLNLLLKNETPVPPRATQDEWRDFLSTLKPHGVLPLLYWHICTLRIEDQLPRDTVHLLRTAFLSSVRRNTLAKKQLVDIISALEQEDISPLVLKGVALAESVYPDSAARPTGDIDLLVFPHQMVRAREILEATGYQCAARYFAASEDLYCQEEFIPVAVPWTRMGVDLHWRVHRFLGVTHKPRTEDLLDRAITDDSSPGPLKTLNPVDSLIHSAFHACLNHNRSMRLIWICDINLLAQQLRVPEDWKLLQTRSVDWCARRAVEDCLKMAGTWCGLKIPREFSDFRRWPAPTEQESTLFSGQSLKKGRSLDLFRLHWPRSLSSVRKVKALLPLLFPPLDILRSRYPVSRKWQIPLRYVQRWSSWLTHIFVSAPHSKLPNRVIGMKTSRTAVRSSVTTFLQFFRFLRPYWKTGVFLLVCSQAVVCLGLVTPYIAKQVVDDAYANRDLRLFVSLVALGAGIFLAESVLSSLQLHYSRRVTKKVGVDIGTEVVSRLYSLNLGYFMNTSSAGSLYKVHYDVEMATRLVTSVVERASKLIPTFVYTLVIVSFLNWRMVLLALVPAVLLYIHAAWCAGRRRRLQKTIVEQDQRIFSRLSESLSKMYLVKASGKAGDENATYQRSLREVLATYFRRFRFEALSNFSSRLLGKVVIGTVAAYGGYQIIRGQMTLGSLTAIMVYLGRIAGVHTSVAGLIQEISIGLISAERLTDVLAQKEESPAEERKITPEALSPSIVFEDVDFYYHRDSYVLENFNMRILPGEKIGLVGPSGCGKSTVINLILGLYRPVSGEVSVGGISTDEVDLDFIRRSTGLVTQQTLLWNATIRENLVYLNENASSAEIEKVIAQAGLRRMVDAQPHGLDTNVSDNACKLSEGQKQRLALARALLKKPRLLILDEGLSFVDNRTIGEILLNIRRDYPNISMLIATHNPRVLEFTDRVIFMKPDSRGVEESQSSLLSADREYLCIRSG